MKKKFAYYAILPALALVLLGAGTASAHGFGFGLFGQNATPQQIAEIQTKMFQQQADLLGTNIDDVKNAWAQGKTLQELATEKGITAEQLKTKLQAQRQQQMKDHMQALVSQGVITQAQADQRLQVMQQKMQNLQNGRGLGRHMGMMGLGF